jgi:hypothetical protein
MLIAIVIFRIIRSLVAFGNNSTKLKQTNVYVDEYDASFLLNVVLVSLLRHYCVRSIVADPSLLINMGTCLSPTRSPPSGFRG